MERNFAATNAPRVRLRVALAKRLRALGLCVKKAGGQWSFLSKMFLAQFFLSAPTSRPGYRGQGLPRTIVPGAP